MNSNLFELSINVIWFIKFMYKVRKYITKRVMTRLYHLTVPTFFHVKTKNEYYNNRINGHLLDTYCTLNLDTNMGVNLGKETQNMMIFVNVSHWKMILTFYLTEI